MATQLEQAIILTLLTPCAHHLLLSHFIRSMNGKISAEPDAIQLIPLNQLPHKGILHLINLMINIIKFINY